MKEPDEGSRYRSVTGSETFRLSDTVVESGIRFVEGKGPREGIKAEADIHSGEGVRHQRTDTVSGDGPEGHAEHYTDKRHGSKRRFGVCEYELAEGTSE